MRRIAALAAAFLLLWPATVSAGEEAAFEPTEASAICEAFFGVAPGPEPLSACQWDMRAIHANAASRAAATGRGVTVGVVDGGVDIGHPDIAPNLDLERSCSFIFSDTPTADPEEVADGDCSNKGAVQDLQGHGTHVATTIAAPLNGIGVVGVAPEATIVALKACTVVGFCFADSVVAALRYAGDQQLDVVNMSLFVDPWLYYCESDAEQKAILDSLEEAARYAQQRGVVIVAAAGNEGNDLGRPAIDDYSPDWPPGSAVTREVANDCRIAPAELTGVVTVSATGVRTLAGYSNVGGPVDVTAPGGDAVQTGGSPVGRILAGWSETDASGAWESFESVGRGVVDDGGRYAWISGTSMASPHAAGVAALVRQKHPGWSQEAVAAAVRRSAAPMACPVTIDPALVRCYRGAGASTYYGSGMVDAEAAATR